MSIYFHGTSRAIADRMRAEGLRVGTYVHVDRSKASAYAMRAAMMRSRDVGVVVTMEIQDDNLELPPEASGFLADPGERRIVRDLPHDVIVGVEVDERVERLQHQLADFNATMNRLFLGSR